MYDSDELIAMVKARQGLARAGTDLNLTGFETSPPAATADIIYNATRTTIPGPQGPTAQVQPGQKLPAYIPVPPGVPQWGMPKSTTNWNAAQFVTTDMQFNSPLALSIEQRYKLSAIAPIIRSVDAIQEAQAEQSQQQRLDVKNTENYQRIARQSSGEGGQEVSQGEKVLGPRAVGGSPHRMNSWYWQ